MKTELIKIDFKKPLAEQLTLPASILRAGGLVAFPTETVLNLISLNTVKSTIAENFLITS